MQGVFENQPTNTSYIKYYVIFCQEARTLFRQNNKNKIIEIKIYNKPTLVLELLTPLLELK